LIGYRDVVKPEWIDRNDHINSMHYKTITDSSMRALFSLGGINIEYATATNRSAFQLEMHICYEREMRLDDTFEVRSWVVAVDRKRLHHIHEIIQTKTNFRAATVELMSVHVNRVTRRSEPFPDDMFARFAAIAEAHAAGPLPSNISRRISMERIVSS
jgi:acyl-CoA thioester hydrolase